VYDLRYIKNYLACSLKAMSYYSGEIGRRKHKV